jgi:branched-chain amino acid transport system substrate-binding protein
VRSFGGFLLATIRISILLALTLLASTAHAEIKIGVSGPFTGQSATFGIQMRLGAQQAVDDINKAGGVLGQKLMLVPIDDEGNRDTLPSIVDQFTVQNVAFVVGHFNSDVSMPAAGYYSQHNILEITPASTSPELTDLGLRNVFRVCGRDDRQGTEIANYLATHAKDARIAIVTDGTPYSTGIAVKLSQGLRTHGMHEIFGAEIPPTQTSMSNLIERLKATGANIIFWGGPGTQGGLIARAIKDANLDTTMIGVDSLGAEDFATAAGDGAIGTLMTFQADPRQRPEAAKVVAEFESAHFNPEAYTLYAYAAVQTIKQAIEKAHTAEPQKVEQVMHSGATFHTVLGPRTFDAKGDTLQSDYIVYHWARQNDGRISYIP